MRRSTWLSIAVVVVVYVGFTWSSSLYFASAEAGRHYDFLTEGFLQGHTHLSIQPHPGLAALANPWAGAQGVPRLHDATYYRGKYYLYFGVSPVLTLLAPWRIITSTHLADVTTVGVFSLAGTLFGIAIWIRAVRRYFGRLSTVWINLGILTFAFAPFITANMERAEFYQIAISCAYAFLMAALWFVFLAATAISPTRRAALLALASLCWGMAIGARPNYIFGLSALGFAGLALFWNEGRRHGFRGWTTWSLLFAAAVPAGVYGLGLMTYNFVRFGSVAEFGQRYQFAAEDFRSTQMLGFRSALPNLKDYFLNPCLYSRYFPFVELPGPTFGTVFWTPFALLGFVFPLILIARRWRTQRGLPIFGLTLYFTALLQITGLLLFAFTHNRYLVDFLPSLTLLGLGAVAVVLLSLEAHRWIRASFGIFASALAVFSIGHALLLTMQRCPNDELFSPVARALNYPVFLWDKLTDAPVGPIDAVVTFSSAEPGTREPLVATSHGRDVLFFEHRPENRVRFGFFHLGTISPYSADIPIEVGKTYRVRVDLGSLYPSRDYPTLWKYPRSAVEALHRRVEVSLDGRLVYHVSSDFYASDPGAIVVGENPLGIGTIPKFQGSFSSVRQIGVPSLDKLGGIAGNGPVKITAVFPHFPAVVGEPLISTGPRGKGDLIFVTYLAPGKVRFGHDSARFGAVESRPIDFDPEAEHSIEIDAPSLYGDSRSDTTGLVQIKFDGKLLISARRTFAPSSAIDVVFGYNAVTSSAAGAMFTGPKLETHRIPPFPPPSRASAAWGAIRMIVMLPQGMIGAQEPLVVTGKTGAGDFVYARYTGPDTVQIGYDHWAIGGFLSDPIKVDYKTSNQIDISFGGLYPASGDTWWTEKHASAQARDTVLVKLNDVIVLNTRYPAHPSDRAAIEIGQNPIGGSTCRPTFTGEIQSVQTIGVPSEFGE